MPPKSKGAPAPARGSKLNLSVGLVNVPIKMSPLVRSTAISGKRICPCHHEPVKAVQTCATTGEIVEAETGFEYQGRFVTGVDRADHKAERDGQLQLTGKLEFVNLDPLYYEKAYLIWPQAGAETAFDLIAEQLRESGKALMGESVIGSSTRVVAIRWSEATGTLVAHTIAYDEAISWNDVALVRAAMDDRRPGVDGAQLELAAQVIDGLSDELDLGEVVDTYNGNLAAAIEAAAEGLPAPVVPAAAPVVESGDLMEALRASVAQATPKAKPKAKANGKAKSKVKA
jgi:DNA end-binding protein Ku